ncbi:hypothetical protein CV093_10210 [Oceanobacillus sp. 143]|uniref:Uncharacterized protein n=1 Tax=Oceanobacillus zhaokaii TaxID=2052660 RepID=A0A345PGP8_9BACI|nr:hypothetical protein [Oceanobacillus zhaokaii]AXI09178.1 hypothetical protein CUC15_09670 [Oceanobacillus zhaokaii]QGS68712.1 hypothetical protein CV093_10210 [Oceanobacillus sp. 143]
MYNTTYINLYWVNINEELLEDYREYVSSYEINTPLELSKLNDKIKMLVAWVVNDGYRANVSGYDDINYLDIYIINRDNIMNVMELIGLRLEEQFKAKKIPFDYNMTVQDEVNEGFGELEYYYLEYIDEEDFKKLVKELEEQGIKVEYKSQHISYFEKGASDWGESFLIGLGVNLTYDLIKSSIRKPRKVNKAKFDKENLKRNVGYNLDIAPASLKMIKIEPSQDDTMMNVVFEDRNNYYSVSCDRFECDLQKSPNCHIITTSKSSIDTPVF